MMFTEAFTGELFKRAAAPTPDHPRILAIGGSVKAASKETEVAPEGKCWKVRWAEGRAMLCFRRRAHAQKFSDSTPDKNPPIYGDVPRSKKTGRAWTVRTQPTLCKTSEIEERAEQDSARRTGTRREGCPLDPKPSGVS